MTQIPSSLIKEETIAFRNHRASKHKVIGLLLSEESKAESKTHQITIRTTSQEQIS
jgi:hypothetical protein